MVVVHIYLGHLVLLLDHWGHWRLYELRHLSLCRWCRIHALRGKLSLHLRAIGIIRIHFSKHFISVKSLMFI